MELLKIKVKADLLTYFEITEKELDHLLYRLPDNYKYYTFTVKKKDNSSRIINSPNLELKILQTKLKDDLLQVFGHKGCVHGFVKDKSILTNAKLHLRKKILVNIDLKDFFSTIHFGRVRGMFMKNPFNFNESIATLLAQVCCFRGYLPQGAPTSPIISNFICRKLDNNFLKFSKENKFYYSRYADDITFSSNKRLSDQLGVLNGENFEVSKIILDQIAINGFSVNESKIRIAFRFNSQSVTGIKVNFKPNVSRLYIKQIRAILNACEKYGVEKAAVVHFGKIDIDVKKLKNPIDFFLKRIVGMVSFVGMVRGKDDFIFAKLFGRVKAIVPNARLSIIHKEIDKSDKTVILTEGKTDWKHINSALSKFQALGMYADLNLTFVNYLDEHKVSNSELYKICESMPKTGVQKNKIICIFDRDDKNFIAKVTSTSTFYKDWTRNVYSMVLPVPKHRDFDNICIEHYYHDNDLHTYDRNNRRIFTSKEFELTGKHKKEDYVFTGNLNKLNSRFPEIIDSQVIDSSKASVALSKNDFAAYVLGSHEGFDLFNIDSFEALFDNIQVIEKLALKS